MNRIAEKFRERLKNCSGYKINLGLHAKLKQDFEHIYEEDIKENLRNPERLETVVQAEKNKFILYFKLSNTLAHKYVVEIRDYEKTIEVITIVKLRIKWQKKAEKYVK